MQLSRLVKVNAWPRAPSATCETCAMQDMLELRALLLLFCLRLCTPQSSSYSTSWGMCFLPSAASLTAACLPACLTAVSCGCNTTTACSFVADETDGRLARKYSQTSTLGAVLDMVTDRYVSSRLLCRLLVEVLKGWTSLCHTQIHVTDQYSITQSTSLTTWQTGGAAGVATYTALCNIFRL